MNRRSFSASKSSRGLRSRRLRLLGVGPSKNERRTKKALPKETDEPNELGEWRTYNFKDGIERTHQVPSLRAQFKKRHEIVNKIC